MSPDQEKIAQWLSGHSSSLHEAYLAALHFLADPKIPGRAQMICHAGRDLCTGLQDLRSATKKKRADTTPVLREIESVWENEGLGVIDIVQPAESAAAAEQTASTRTTIPRHLMKLLQRLMEEHRRADTNQEEQAAQLFRASDPATANRPETMQPLSREWVNLRRWFIRYAHFGVQQRTPKEQELQQQFASLESFILGIIRTFYEGMEGLDEILDEANS
jgi:hypothetical protein